MHRSSVDRLGQVSLPPSQVLASALARPATAKTLKAIPELYLAKRSLISLRGVVEKMPNLEALWVNQNHLITLEGLQNSTRLRALYAHGNRVEDIGEGLVACSSLTDLTLHDNRLLDLEHALDSLRHLEHLHSLTLHGNPATNEADYRSRVIAVLPALEVLDNQPVTAIERVAAESKFGDGRGRGRPAPLAFGTRGRNGTTLRVGMHQEHPAISGQPPRVKPVAEVVQAEADKVRRRLLSQKLLDTYGSVGTPNTRGVWGHDADLVVSALINITDPAVAEGPVAEAVRAAMASRGVPVAEIQGTGGRADSSIRESKAVPVGWANASALMGTASELDSHLRQSLIPRSQPSYASQRIAPAQLAGGSTESLGRSQLMVNSSPPGQTRTVAAVAGLSSLIGELPRADIRESAASQRLSATEVKQLIMQRTGLRLQSKKPFLLREPRRGGGPEGSRDKQSASHGLGEWDKLHLLCLLRNAAGPSSAGCVSGAQLRAAIAAMADYGCIAIAPDDVGAGDGASDDPEQCFIAFLTRQMRIMDPRGTDKFGYREFVESQDTGIYQVFAPRLRVLT